jgi:hypothetical protein
MSVRVRLLPQQPEWQLHAVACVLLGPAVLAMPTIPMPAQLS